MDNKAKYEMAAEIAQNFEDKCYSKEDAATYLSNMGLDYDFAIQILVNMK